MTTSTDPIRRLPTGLLGDQQWDFDSTPPGGYIYAHVHGEDAGTIGVIGAHGLSWEQARDLANMLDVAVADLEDELRADLKDGLLTPADAAKRLAVGVAHVRKLIRAGDLMAINCGTHGAPRWRVRESELLAFIERRTEA